MKNLIPILLAVVVLSSGCDRGGYSCNSEGCYEENNAQYLTLDDCLSECLYGCGEIEHQGYSYSTIIIGEQCWFAENCRYLPSLSPLNEASETDPHYYVLDYEGIGGDHHGVLYNWPAVMTEGVCPSGWHIPSDEEWQILEMSLGMSEVEASSIGSRGSVGEHLKSAWGWEEWNGNNANGTNSSGWTGLPGGTLYYSGTGTSYGGSGNVGQWWSSSEVEDNITLPVGMVGPDGASWGRRMSWNNYVSRESSKQSSGFSARCIQD